MYTLTFNLHYMGSSVICVIWVKSAETHHLSLDRESVDPWVLLRTHKCS